MIITNDKMQAAQLQAQKQAAAQHIQQQMIENARKQLALWQSMLDELKAIRQLLEKENGTEEVD